MPATVESSSGTAFERRWSTAYSAVVLAVLVPLYLFTRPGLLISDGQSWITEASLGDPRRMLYGFPTYLLQVPLAHEVWRLLQSLGVPVSVSGVFLGISLAGTLTAAVFLGLIAADILRVRSAAWIAAFLFGISLNPWTQWNGELSGLPVGLVTAALFLALRGRIILPALLWAFSVLSQVNFALAAPAFIMTVWFSRSKGETPGSTLRRTASLPALAATAAVVLFLVGSYALGKWSDPNSLAEWLSECSRTVARSVSGSPEVPRAVMGLVTAFTAAGHTWRDVLTGRGAYGNPLFVPTAAVGGLFLVVTGVLLVAAAWQRRLALFALVWLLPFHILFNWWYVPTEEEYHTGALPGFILLVTAGLVQVSSRIPRLPRYSVYAVYLSVCLGLNLFTAVLPRQTLGLDLAEAERRLRQLNEEHAGRIVLVTCDGGNVEVVRRVGVEYLRIRSIWNGSVPDIQDAVLSWTRARLAEGKEPYLLDRWCWPEEWKTSWSKEPFDLWFLERYFRLTPTRVVGVPVAQPSTTDSFTWRQGDVVRMDPQDGRRR